MPNRRYDNDYPEDLRNDIEYIDKEAKEFRDEPILRNDAQDKIEYQKQLAKDKDHPAYGLDVVVDEND